MPSQVIGVPLNAAVGRSLTLTIVELVVKSTKGWAIQELLSDRAVKE